MKFDNVTIKNFRNFEDINLKLSNKNVFFGLNDVGKTNFLFALRYLFDKDVRKQGLIDSDFHNRQTQVPIEIIVTIDIESTEDVDCQKLRAQLKGALRSSDSKVYIKLIAEYDNNELLAVPVLYWGGALDRLQEMKPRGYLYEIDYVFNVIKNGTEIAIKKANETLEEVRKNMGLDYFDNTNFIEEMKEKFNN